LGWLGRASGACVGARRREFLFAILFVFALGAQGHLTFRPSIPEIAGAASVPPTATRTDAVATTSPPAATQGALEGDKVFLTIPVVCRELPRGRGGGAVGAADPTQRIRPGIPGVTDAMPVVRLARPLEARAMAETDCVGLPHAGAQVLTVFPTEPTEALASVRG
jgi:hypothetical protein